MKILTIEDIRAFKPCIDPSNQLSEDWTGTIFDLLKDDSISFGNRLWVGLRNDFLSDKGLRLFAVWCARRALSLVENPDPRSINVCDMAERYANGHVTKKNLYDAWINCILIDWFDCTNFVTRYAEEAAHNTAFDDPAEAANGAGIYSAMTVASYPDLGKFNRDKNFKEMQSQIEKLIEMIEAENA